MDNSTCLGVLESLKQEEKLALHSTAKEYLRRWSDLTSLQCQLSGLLQL